MSNWMHGRLPWPRLLVLARVVIALVGGYSLAAILSMIAAKYSSLEGRELRSLIYLVFFLLYPIAIIWLFSINSHRKALLATLIANACAWMSLYALDGLS